MDEYQKYLLEESKKLRAAQSKASGPQDQPAAVNMKGMSRQEKKLESQKKSTQQVQHQALKKELQSMETQMKQLEVQKQALIESMASMSSGESAAHGASAKAKDAALEMAKSAKALKEMESQLEALEEKWLDISQSLEAMG